MNCSFSRGLFRARLLSARVSILALLLLVPSCKAQEPSTGAESHASVNTTLPVNWVYGAYIPKDAPVVPLTGDERFKLYLRQTYTTPGIYVKTVLFSIHDQAKETEPAWGDGISGYGKRLGSLHAGNIIQNSLTSLGNAAVEIAEDNALLNGIVHEYKTKMRRRLRKLARESGARESDSLGDALMLLMDGGYYTRLTFPHNSGLRPLAAMLNGSPATFVCASIVR